MALIGGLGCKAAAYIKQFSVVSHMKVIKGGILPNNIDNLSYRNIHILRNHFCDYPPA